jgi:aryl-alcohol dehydrogenase-like predicted oxidoreductase
MEYVPLGRSGLRISPACLGAMNFGSPAGTPGCDETEAGRIIAAYLDAGGNIIDTADGYSGGQSDRRPGGQGPAGCGSPGHQGVPAPRSRAK